MSLAYLTISTADSGEDKRDRRLEMSAKIGKIEREGVKDFGIT